MILFMKNFNQIFIDYCIIIKLFNEFVYELLKKLLQNINELSNKLLKFVHLAMEHSEKCFEFVRPSIIIIN